MVGPGLAGCSRVCSAANSAAALERPARFASCLVHSFASFPLPTNRRSVQGARQVEEAVCSNLMQAAPQLSSQCSAEAIGIPLGRERLRRTSPCSFRRQVHWQLPSNFEPPGSEHAAHVQTCMLSEEAADTEVDTLSHLTAAHKMQIYFALVYFGVAPEFSETVEAQEAHAGMFDLSARVRRRGAGGPRVMQPVILIRIGYHLQDDVVLPLRAS